MTHSDISVAENDLFERWQKFKPRCFVFDVAVDINLLDNFFSGKIVKCQFIDQHFNKIKKLRTLVQTVSEFI